MSNSVCWFEPRWSYGPRVKRELVDLLRPGMWLRVSVVCSLLTYLLAKWVHRTFPDLVFDWVGSLLKAIIVMAASLGAYLGLLFVLPPYIIVGAKGISRQQGQSTYWRRRQDIQAITVDWTDPTRPLLRVSAKRPLTVGIGPKIARTELTRFLHQTFPEALVEEKLPAQDRALI